MNGIASGYNLAHNINLDQDPSKIKYDNLSEARRELEGLARHLRIEIAGLLRLTKDSDFTGYVYELDIKDPTTGKLTGTHRVEFFKDKDPDGNYTPKIRITNGNYFSPEIEDVLLGENVMVVPIYYPYLLDANRVLPTSLEKNNNGSLLDPSLNPARQTRKSRQNYLSLVRATAAGKALTKILMDLSLGYDRKGRLIKQQDLPKSFALKTGGSSRLA